MTLREMEMRLQAAIEANKLIEKWESTQPDTLERRQEKLALIRHLRDTTDDPAVWARCKAIVGERT